MKTFFRRLLKITLWTLTAASALLLCTYLSFRFIYAGTDSTEIAYLKNNIVATISASSPADTLVLPADLARKKLVLLGEMHGSAAPQDLDLALVKAMSRQAGLRHYIAEVDPAQAFCLNRYLETGDEKSLARVFDLWTSQAQWGNTAFENKIRALRSFNQTLPPEKRIRIVGLDRPQDWTFLVSFLNEQLPGALPADYVPTRPNEYPNRHAKRLLETLSTHHTWLKSEPKSPLGALRASLEATATGKGREYTIVESYRFQVTRGEIGNAPAYGLWGWFHVNQGKLNNTPSFAAQIKNSDLPAASSMATLLIAAKNLNCMIPVVALPKALQVKGKKSIDVDCGGIGPYNYIKGIGSFTEAAPAANTWTFFDLTAASSPYRQGRSFGENAYIFGILRMTDESLSTADYFQYVAYTSYSPAAPAR